MAAPAPAVEAHPLAGAGAGPARAPVTPGQALALQRSAGNRAVTRILARRTPPPPAGTAPGASAATAKGLKHGDFAPTGGDPTASGNVTVSASGPSAVTVNAPQITATGSVAWNPPAAAPAAPGTPATPPPATPPAGTPPAAPGAAPAGGAPAAPAAPPTEARAGWINTLLSADRVSRTRRTARPAARSCGRST